MQKAGLGTIGLNSSESVASKLCRIPGKRCEKLPLRFAVGESVATKIMV